MNWHGRTLSAYTDLIDAVTRVGSPEEAQEFLSAYRQVNPHADVNVGWMIGDVDRDVGRRIIEWFGCSHPVFGTTFPTFEEALRKGIEMGQAMNEGGIDRLNKMLPPRNPNSWFIGALDDE